MTQKITRLSAGTSSASSETTTKGTRALLTCGLIAGPLFILLIVIQALTRPGFDLRRHPASMLSLGDLGWIQIANFMACGLLIVAFAVGLRRVLHPGRGGTWGPLLIGAYGLGLIAAGAFVADPAFGFPPGTPQGIPTTLSLNAVLHGIGFTFAFVSLTLACIVFARRYAAIQQRGWAPYTFATAVAALALSMWPGQDGASVRYFIASVIVCAWTSAIALQVMAENPRS
jgi:hypothetical membrane protein